MQEPPKTALDRWMQENRCEDAELAARLRVSRSQVNRLRRGKSKPPLKRAEALAKITGLPVLTLMKALKAPGRADA